jgi:DNA replication ATP-dependent helicase Dna2
VFVCSGISEGEVVSLVTPLLPAAQRWATDYAALKAALTSTTATGGQFDWQPASSHRAVVSRVLTTEENIWSPAYGLKGKLDATVLLTVTPSDSNLKQTTLVPTNQSTAQMHPEKHLVPFELKTGKSIQNAHHAQLSLYTMMLSDRYDMATPHGLLMHLSAKPGAPAHGVLQLDWIFFVD